MNGRFGEIALIALIVLLLFGAGKLPTVMRDLGRGIRLLKEEINNDPTKDNLDQKNQNESKK